MSFTSYALCCFLLASSSLARADAILTGTVSVTNPNTGTTSTSGSGSSVSISATDPSGAFASIVGNVGPTAGTVVAAMSSEFVGPPPNSFVTAGADYSLTVNGTYMLTGGTGLGLADWRIDAFTLGSGPANWTACSITLAGTTQTCVLDGTAPAIGSFLVPFNTPLNLSFNAAYSGSVSLSDAHQSTLTYNFDLTPVPEPATALLLTTALAPLAKIARRVIAKHRESD